MVFAATDIFGMFCATLLAIPILVLPGLAVAHLTGVLDFDELPPIERLGVGLLVAHAVVPLFASLGLRWTGAAPLVVALVAVSVFAVSRRMSDLRALVTRTNLAVLAAVIAVFVVLNADFDIAGRLYQSLLMTDMFKHALFVRVLAEHGAPPVDPFFLRDTPASYYYFYYAPAALVFKAGLGLIDQRAAFVGVQVWTAVAVVFLVLTVLTRSGLAPRNRAGLLSATLVLMSSAGLQLFLVLLTWMKGGAWREQSGWLNDMVNSFLISAVWVPHHVSAFIAAWVALMILAGLAERASRPNPDLRAVGIGPGIAVAGAALASMAGQSVWVSFGAVATVVVWTLLLSWERRWHAVAAIVSAGVLSLVLAAPYLVDLVAYRDVSNAAVAVRVRYFALAEILATIVGGGETLARLLLLPFNYAFEAAIFVAGSIVFWRRKAPPDRQPTELARLLSVGCVTSLVLGSFFASTIGNNDFGWRVVLFAQLAALVWTLNVFAPVWQRAARSLTVPGRLRLAPRSLMPLLAAGLLAGAHDLVMLRAHLAVNREHPDAHPVDTAVAHDVRATYAWLAANLPPTAIVQHNPSVVRSTGFGLYGRQQVAVSDLHSAALFGANPNDAARRLTVIGQIFAGRTDAATARKELADRHITALLVTSADPLWSAPAGWFAEARPIYERANVRVYLAAALPSGLRRVSASGLHGIGTP